MRISIVCSFFLPVPPVRGGAMEKIWFRLGREFAARGHAVTLFSRTWPGFPDREVIDGMQIVRVPGFDHTRRTWRNLALDFLWGLRVARRLPPGDIVACNTVSLPAHLFLTRPSAGRVVVVLSRMSKGHAHFYGRIDRLIATSEAVKAKALAENGRLRDRTTVLPNPIDWQLHHACVRKAGPSAPRTMGYCGRLHPEKGVEILVQAAAELARRPGLPPWRLRLIGPQRVSEGGGGEQHVEGLRRLAAQAGADISIEPPIYDAVKLAEVYGTLDVFCYPSLAEKGEGLSVAPIEAMAADAVPVVSALDCYHDVIRDGINGLVFDHRAPDRALRLADCLARLLSDPPARERMAIQAREDARRFDYGVVAEELLADFAGLAAGRGGAR